MVRPSNGWGAVRQDWAGALGTHSRAPMPPPVPSPTFRPSTWKPVVPGKTYPMGAGLGVGEARHRVTRGSIGR
jgi:hypothetical protein